MDSGEAIRDYVEIALLCVTIITTAYAAIRKMTRIEVLVDRGFDDNRDDHREIKKEVRDQGDRLRTVEKDVAVMCRDDRER